MITYDEFKTLVKKSLAENLTQLSDKQLEEYINNDESEKVIKNEYEMSSKQLEHGEITEQIFRNGSASSAAWCLYMLY